MNVALALDVRPNADVELTLAGNTLKARGEGTLNLQIDPRSNIFEIYGDYTLTEGSFQLSLQNIISKRFTIENGSRELDLVREKDGRVCNSVIHTITRESENAKQNIDQDMLLDMALRYHPDIICVGEMRSAEAYAAQEAARTGHGVLTTIHSNSSQATWRRMVTLCKRKHEMADDTLMDLVTAAFPIVVFAKQLEDKSRKIMEIMECEILPTGERRYNTLYHFKIEENRLEDGKYRIKGRHEAVTPLSDSLQKRIIDNGMPQEVLTQLVSK